MSAGSPSGAPICCGRSELITTWPVSASTTSTVRSLRAMASRRKLSTVTSKCTIAGLDPSGIDHRGHVGDDPLVGVRGQVRLGLVHLVRVERERRREERLLVLLQGQVGVAGALAAHGAGVLRAGRVDEAGLADPVGVELLQIAQRAVDRVQRRPAAPHPPVPVARLGVEPPVLGTVRGEQDDRTRPGEVGVEHLRLLRRVMRQIVALPGQRAGVPGEPGGDTDDQQHQCAGQTQQQRSSHSLTPSSDSCCPIGVPSLRLSPFAGEVA